MDSQNRQRQVKVATKSCTRTKKIIFGSLSRDNDKSLSPTSTFENLLSLSCRCRATVAVVVFFHCRCRADPWLWPRCHFGRKHVHGRRGSGQPTYRGLCFERSSIHLRRKSFHFRRLFCLTTIIPRQWHVSKLLKTRICLEIYHLTYSNLQSFPLNESFDFVIESRTTLAK